MLSRRSSLRISYALCLLGLAFVALLWGMGGEESGYDWQWRRALRHVGTWDGEFAPGPLLLGLGLTVRIVGVGLLLALGTGLATAVLRYSPSVVARGLASLYVGTVRNTPLLIQLFAMYFVLAPLVGIGPFWAGVWALALFEGAYMAEIFRGGLSAVPHTQWDAAASLGFAKPQAFIFVVLPQALRRVLPPLTSQSVSLIKDSALVSAIALPDLTMQAQAVIAETFLSLELWSLVAAIYLLLTLCISIPARYLEKRYAWQWL